MKRPLQPGDLIPVDDAAPRRERSDTQWLLFWAGEWARRLVCTLWHLVNRRAYRAWCAKQGYRGSGREEMLLRRAERVAYHYREFRKAAFEEGFEG